MKSSGGIWLHKGIKKRSNLNKVEINPGWANPFGKQPPLDKHILLGRNTTPKEIKNKNMIASNSHLKEPVNELNHVLLRNTNELIIRNKHKHKNKNKNN